MTEEAIKAEIASMQDELNKLTLKHKDLTSQDVVSLSMKLDELIVEYLRMGQEDR